MKIKAEPRTDGGAQENQRARRGRPTIRTGIKAGPRNKGTTEY